MMQRTGTAIASDIAAITARKTVPVGMATEVDTALPITIIGGTVTLIASGGAAIASGGTAIATSVVTAVGHPAELTAEQAATLSRAGKGFTAGAAISSPLLTSHPALTLAGAAIGACAYQAYYDHPRTAQIRKLTADALIKAKSKTFFKR